MRTRFQFAPTGHGIADDATLVAALPDRLLPSTRRPPCARSSRLCEPTASPRSAPAGVPPRPEIAQIVDRDPE
jgi:hypothetical protein